MTTTATPDRVVIESFPSVADDAEARDNVREGLLEALSNLSAYHPVIDALYEEKPGIEPAVIRPWSDTYHEAVDEILPDVIRRLDQTIAKRLPWTWTEGEDR